MGRTIACTWILGGGWRFELCFLSKVGFGSSTKLLSFWVHTFEGHTIWSSTTGRGSTAVPDEDDDDNTNNNNNANDDDSNNNNNHNSNHPHLTCPA